MDLTEGGPVEEFIVAFPRLAAYLLVGLAGLGVAIAGWGIKRILANQEAQRLASDARHAENVEALKAMREMMDDEIRLLTHAVHGHDVRITYLEAINGLLPGTPRRRSTDRRHDDEPEHGS
jgi:hypothetical protein